MERWCLGDCYEFGVVLFVMLLRSVELEENMEEVVSDVMVGPSMFLRLGQGDVVGME